MKSLATGKVEKVALNVCATSEVVSLLVFWNFFSGPQAIPSLHFNALNRNAVCHYVIIMFSFPLQIIIPQTSQTDLGNFSVFHVAAISTLCQL